MRSHPLRPGKVRAGAQLYISGQLSRDQDGTLLGKGDVTSQYRQVWSNLKLALAAVGLSPEHLVKTTTYVVGVENIPALRAIRQELSPAPPPTSTMVVVAGLAVSGALVEVDAIAWIPSS